MTPDRLQMRRVMATLPEYRATPRGDTKIPEPFGHQACVLWVIMRGCKENCSIDEFFT